MGRQRGGGGDVWGGMLRKRGLHSLSDSGQGFLGNGHHPILGVHPSNSEPLSLSLGRKREALRLTSQSGFWQRLASNVVLNVALLVCPKFGSKPWSSFASKESR